jgi:hypothetical protein
MPHDYTEDQLPEQRRIVAELDALPPAILDKTFKGEL